MEDGNVIYLDGEVEEAFAFDSVLSLPTVLDELVPMIEAATGD